MKLSLLAYIFLLSEIGFIRTLRKLNLIVRNNNGYRSYTSVLLLRLVIINLLGWTVYSRVFYFESAKFFSPHRHKWLFTLSVHTEHMQFLINIQLSHAITQQEVAEWAIYPRQAQDLLNGASAMLWKCPSTPPATLFKFVEWSLDLN